MIYSHSRLGTFEECPRKFWYAYIGEIEVPAVETVEAFLGQRVHEALEALYQHLLNGRLMNRQELLDFFNQAWKQEWNSAIRIVSREYKEADYKAVGQTALEAYYDRHHPFNRARTLALETKIRLDLDGTGRYRLIGYVDRVAQRPDGTYEIHDYKTSRRLPTQAEADQDRQLALYHLGIQSRWSDVEKVELIWHFLRFDKQIVSGRTSAELARVKAQCKDLIDAIEACGRDESRFPTRRSRLCNWCEYDGVCPVMRHQVSVRQKSPAEVKADAGVQLVECLSRLAKKRASLREKLAQIETEEEKIFAQLLELARRLGLESIAGRTHRVDVVTVTRLAYPKAGDPDRARFEAALKKAGLWDDVVALNAQRFRSRWKQLPAPNRKHLATFVREESVVKPLFKAGGAEKA